LYEFYKKNSKKITAGKSGDKKMFICIHTDKHYIS